VPRGGAPTLLELGSAVGHVLLHLFPSIRTRRYIENFNRFLRVFFYKHLLLDYSSHREILEMLKEQQEKSTKTGYTAAIVC
jgi:hypothetical protein